MSVKYELVLEKILNCTPEKAYRCWTEPELIKQWFAPKPWATSKVINDVRAGGDTCVTMRSPEGQEFPNPGVYLEIVPGKKIVFTDAFSKAWEPVEGTPFFVGIVTFDDAGNGRTKYTARARHWTEENCKKHKQMGFHAGWASVPSSSKIWPRHSRKTTMQFISLFTVDPASKAKGPPSQEHMTAMMEQITKKLASGDLLAPAHSACAIRLARARSRRTAPSPSRTHLKAHTRCSGPADFRSSMPRPARKLSLQ